MLYIKNILNNNILVESLKQPKEDPKILDWL